MALVIIHIIFWIYRWEHLSHQYLAVSEASKRRGWPCTAGRYWRSSIFPSTTLPMFHNWNGWIFRCSAFRFADWSGNEENAMMGGLGHRCKCFIQFFLTVWTDTLWPWRVLILENTSRNYDLLDILCAWERSFEARVVVYCHGGCWLVDSLIRSSDTKMAMTPSIVSSIPSHMECALLMQVQWPSRCGLHF